MPFYLESKKEHEQKHSKENFLTDTLDASSFLIVVGYDLSLSYSQTMSKVPKHEMKAHSYLTGKTGSWKSSLIAQWVYHLWKASNKDKNIALIVIDPHGDMVHTMRKFDLMRDDRKRLIYVDPMLWKDYTPTLNPLECWETNPIHIEIRANQLMRVFEEMIPDAKLSNYMKAVLKPCLYVLLKLHTCSLHDLQEFLTNEESIFIERGKNCGIRSYQEFFRWEFHNPIYLRTKQSIYTKIQSLLNQQVFSNLVTGKSTIDLERAMRQGKIVLFNLSKWKIGEEVAETFWRFIIAQVKSIAFQRAKLPKHLRKPTYLFIDEADTFIKGNSLNVILTESRKYGIHLILSTQNIVYGKGNEKLKRNLLNNTNVKIIGANGHTTLKVFALDTGIPIKDLQKLSFHEFRLAYGSKHRKRIKIKDVFWRGSPLLMKKWEVLSQTHRLLKESGYYKPILPAKSYPEEWMDSLPISYREQVEKERFPRGRYGE